MVAIILVNYNGADDTIDCIKSLSEMKEYAHVNQTLGQMSKIQYTYPIYNYWDI